MIWVGTIMINENEYLSRSKFQKCLIVNILELVF